MAGGYVFQKRDVVNTKSIARDGKIPSGMISNEGFRGFPLTLPQTNLLVHQETYSFRTNRYSDPAEDLTSAGEILRYYLMHGISTEFDTGHDFWTTKTWTNYSHKETFVRSGAGTSWGRGCLNPGTPPIPTVSSLDVNFYGNKAISAVSPNAPNANLAQTAAEIMREKGIALPGTSLFAWLESRALFYRSLGKEYLNVAFGWKPFLNDLYKIVHEMLDINEEIRRYSAISGLATDRRYDFLPIESNSTSELGFDRYLNFGPGSNIASWDEVYAGNPNRKLLISETRSQRIYFKGNFTFALGPSKGFLGQLEAFEQFANKLLGTRITPTVLWELTPWSWLIDWFVDVQSAISAAGLQLDDGVLMRWAYLMRETRNSTSYTVDANGLFVVGPNGPVSATTHYVRKERVRGTPFGFGLNPDAITPGQWAILAALAISKGPRKLPKLPQGEPTE
ncbi:maturation protein [ssRNA phage Zoerhiza.4_5]|uniref:Maturation protein n=2 Tax=Leviviricetes TaxID=2842243 RepID=A0A8S5KYC8_9VIRU|nr:maturation protein [ssRNA phage Zoerhiza.4_5]QDH88609.1 MAG: hypothetical protein H4Rhizo43371_000002 [Leviviridae sp.]DAD50053.1 TPA_asm: maturation protein [ssRNA phage Zoerhiza.4_5]